MAENKNVAAEKTEVVANKRRLLPRFVTRQHKDLGHPAVVILVTFLIFLFSQFIAALLVGFAAALQHPHSSLSYLLSQSATYQFFYVLLAEGLAALTTIYVVKRVMRMSLATIGLGRRPQWNDALKAVLGAVAFYVLLIVASIILSALIPSLNSDQKQDVGFNDLNTKVDGVLAFVALVFIPPLGEETLVRGYLYSGLRMRWKFLPAMLVTSLLFGAAHLQTGEGAGVLWAAAVDTFILSVVLVYLREKTGALYAGMMVHALNNTIAFGVHFHGILF